MPPSPCRHHSRCRSRMSRMQVASSRARGPADGFTSETCRRTPHTLILVRCGRRSWQGFRLIQNAPARWGGRIEWQVKGGEGDGLKGRDLDHCSHNRTPQRFVDDGGNHSSDMGREES